MPSSPGPNDYKRRPQRFFHKGISLLPQDAINDSGKSAWAFNIRSYMPGTWTPRIGTSRAAETPAPAAIHSIFRMDDPTPLGVGNEATRIVGAADGLYRQVVGNPIGAQIDSGYSGDPLTAVITAPSNSPQPFTYIGDSDRTRKVASDGTVSEVGLAPPTVAPTAALAEPQVTDLEFLMEGGDWTPYGGETDPLAPDLAPIIDRVDTVLTQFLFDSGASGMASAAVENFENITAGMLLNVGAERIIVQEVHPPVSPTTIDGIMYDSGTTGLCTIQPAGSFSAGQIEAPDPDITRHRYQGLAEPLPPQVTVTRTIDYPVDALVTLDGSEVVRIQSVAVGPDGVQSFRCFTFGTFGAGATIEGLASFRAWFAAAHAISEVVQVSATQIEATALDTENPIVAGVQTAIPDVDWGRVGDRATQPEDIIRLGVRISLMGFVQSVRFVLDVDNPMGASPANEFLRNYYFYEWRASDLISAIQASGQVATNQIFEAQAGAVEQGQVAQAYSDQYGYSGLPGNRRSPGTPITFNPEDPVDPNTFASPGAVPRDGLVSVGSGLSRQLALGNDVWITLECRVGDLSRVGTNQTFSLHDVNDAVIYAQILGTEDTVTLSFSDPYLTGGYGPDAAATLPPYVYRYRYRCSATGARSNPSPTMRAGVAPRRMRVDLSWTPSSDPQVDLVDVFRYGGSLARWAYVASFPNADGVAPDDMEDSQIDGGETLRVDFYQPWPTSDIPRGGTCNVVGTSVEWVSGDQFNTGWGADSAIIINGRTTQLYGPPSSATRLEVIDNCGNGTGVEFTLPSPTILATPMPALWGGPINNVWFTFAAGDPNDPSALHWSHGNDPETTSDAFVLFLSSPSEPLLNGCFYDGFPYAFSSERLYRIVPTFGDITTFRTQETQCTRGLWCPWAFCVTPFGIVFLSRDGIYITQGGSEAQSLTNPDLQMLFPQDGAVPEAIRNLNPIDFSQPDRLRLSPVDQGFYFDYVDTAGEGRTLFYRFSEQSWIPDVYPVAWGGVRVRLEEPGEGTYNVLLGMGDGFLNQMDANQLTDVDESMPWAYWTSWEYSDDPRAMKQWGDAILDFNPAGSVNGVLVTPVIINGNTALTPHLVGVDGTVRDTFIIEVEDGVGMLSRNFGLWIEGALDLCDTNRPIFYLWEPSWLFKQITVARRATDWEDFGYKGAKFIQGVVLRANTYGLDKCLAVEYDGPNISPQEALVLTINHDGEQSIAYPKVTNALPDAPWDPFIAELVRLHGVDDEEWSLLDWRFIWEPAPELATQWQTQETTFDAPGFGHVKEGVMAYAAPAPVALTIWHDLNPLSYTLPATTGYQRIYAIFGATKGKAVRFRWTSTEPFRLFKRDCSVRWQPWGQPGGYQIVNPFGGPHRDDGAGI